jgi:hypothetical protein
LKFVVHLLVSRYHQLFVSIADGMDSQNTIVAAIEAAQQRSASCAGLEALPLASKDDGGFHRIRLARSW